MTPAEVAARLPDLQDALDLLPDDACVLSTSVRLGDELCIDLAGGDAYILPDFPWEWVEGASVGWREHRLPSGVAIRVWGGR